MIKKLKVKNFKCFREEKEFDFGRITLLLGANSSGKSSVLQAILVAMQSEVFPFEIDLYGKLVDLRNFDTIVNHQTKSGEILIELEFAGNLPLTLEIGLASGTKQGKSWIINDSTVVTPRTSHRRVNPPDGNIPTVQTLILDEHQNPDDEIDFHLRRFLKRMENAPVGQSADLSILVNELRSYASGKVSPSLPAETEELKYHIADFLCSISKIAFADVAYLGPNRATIDRTFRQGGENGRVRKDGQSFLDQIAKWDMERAGKVEELGRRLKDIQLVEELETKKVGSDNLELFVKIPGSVHAENIIDVGSGVAQFMPVAVLDMQLPDSSTLMLAEPETHLHPSVQANIGDYLARQVGSTSKNYIVETHSEYLINRIRLNIVRDTLKPEDLQVYFLENKSDGTIVHKVTFAKNGQILGAPASFFTTYEMDVMDIALEAMAE